MLIVPTAIAALLLIGVAAWAAPIEKQKETRPILAVGRVVFCVTEHSIVVAAIGDPRVPGSRPPAIVPIGSGYLGVILGPVQWDHGDDENTKTTRIDVDLPPTAANAQRRIDKAPPNEPSDIEKMAVAVLELIRPMIEDIHYSLDLPPDQPLFEMILADYSPDYGPEIWNVEYRVRQDLLETDYWNSEIQRPSYYQLYPPKKGQPHAPIEVQYPKKMEAGFLDRLVRHDPMFEPIRSSSSEMEEAAAAMTESRTGKMDAAPIAKFLRSALPLTISPKPPDSANSGKAALTMALLEDRRGFEWLLPPTQAVPVSTDKQEPGAPSLRKYIPPDN